MSVSFRVARDPSRVDAKRGDHLLLIRLIHLEMDQTEFLYQASERVYITASGWETEFSETMGLVCRRGMRPTAERRVRSP